MTRRAASTPAPGAWSFAATAPVNNRAGEPEEIEIDGKTFNVAKSSLQGDSAAPEWLSTRRLTNGDSAKLVTFSCGNIEQRAVEFNLNPHDDQISAGVRAELRDVHESVNGDETWYRFSTLLPKTFPIDARHRLVLAQWHDHLRNDELHLRPPLSHRLWNGRFVVTLWNKHRVGQMGTDGDGEILFEIPRIERGVFHEFVYKVRWSHEDDGEVIAWMRQSPLLSLDCEDSTSWQEIISYQGSIGYDDETVTGYYFKIGLYTVREFDVPFTAYHKDYHRGDSAEAVGVDAAKFR